jgi:5-methylcytosine-specific restriction endonuclease McrA
MPSQNWPAGSTNSRAWRRTRARVLDRDGRRCQLRIPDVCKGRADSVHHLEGRAAGDHPSGLVASCRPCNQRIGDPTRGGTVDPQPQPIPWW